MLLKTYESKNLLCNVSVNGATSEAGIDAFRGDLVVEDGDIVDERPLPPKSVVKQAVVLIKNDKLEMVAGELTDIDHLPVFVARYRSDLAPLAKVLMYVENLGKPASVDLDGIGAILLPHDEGAVWNTLMEDLKLEKEDFKGQSAEDKVITMYNGLLEFKPRGVDVMSLEDAIKNKIESRRTVRGPV